MLRVNRKWIWIPSLALALAGSACGPNQTFPAERDPYQPAALEPLECVPNLDGQIDAAELGPAFGVELSYLVSPVGEERAVDLVGAVGDDGRRVWDWGADYLSDQVARLGAIELAGQWYANSFPESGFVAPLDAGGTLHGVYRKDEQGIHLLGMASAAQLPSEEQVLLVYQTPVDLFRYPLAAGDAWVSVGEVQNGVFRGLPYAGRDTYQVEVVASGELILPDLTFSQVLEVHTRTVVEPSAGATSSQRQVSFLFECFGEVARATSRLDEPEQDFLTASEVRRLGL